MLQFHCLSKILIIPYQHLFNLADIHCMIVYLFHIKNLIKSACKGSDFNRFFVLLRQRLEYFKKKYGTTAVQRKILRHDLN